MSRSSGPDHEEVVAQRLELRGTISVPKCPGLASKTIPWAFEAGLPLDACLEGVNRFSSSVGHVAAVLLLATEDRKASALPEVEVRIAARGGNASLLRLWIELINWKRRWCHVFRSKRSARTWAFSFACGFGPSLIALTISTEILMATISWFGCARGLGHRQAGALWGRFEELQKVWRLDVGRSRLC